MTLVEFLRARVAESDEDCEGSGEYISCRDLSERRRREVKAHSEMLDTLGHGLNDLDTAWLAKLALEEWATAYADHPDYDEAWRP